MKTNLKGYKRAGYRMAVHPKHGMANLSEEDYERLCKEDTSRYGTVRLARRGEIGEAIASEDIKRGDLVVGKAPDRKEEPVVHVSVQLPSIEPWMMREALQKAQERRRERRGDILGGVFLVLTIALLLSFFALLSQPAHAEQAVQAVEQKQVVQATVTAYTSSVDETDDTPFETASGALAQDGVVACPSKYPFGTKVEIGGRVYTCEDRMHSRFADRFDVWMETKADAFEFGKQTLAVAIID